MNRGEHRERIFLTDADRQLFLGTLEEGRQGELDQKFKPVRRGWTYARGNFARKCCVNRGRLEAGVRHSVHYRTRKN